NDDRSAAKKSRKIRLRLKQDRFCLPLVVRVKLQGPHSPMNLFLRARRGWFTTRATKDCSLPAARASRYAAFATRLMRRGSGVIRRRARHFVFLTPARKSSSSQSRANDLTKPRV